MAEQVTITIPTDPAVADLATQVATLSTQVASLSSQLADMSAKLGKFSLVNPFADSFSASFGSAPSASL